MANVSGKAFLGLIRYVRESGSPTEVKDLVAKGSDLVQQTFAERIRVTRWYPYAAYAAFLRILNSELGKGDAAFMRGIGAAAGRRDLGTILRVYVAIASPERMIRSCSKVWSSYYRDAGEMTASAWSDGDTRVRISGFPEMTSAHCRLMEGWMIAAMDMIGCPVNDGAHETICTNRGGEFHEFWCTWRRR
jgi:hypothetical protein